MNVDLETARALAARLAARAELADIRLFGTEAKLTNVPTLDHPLGWDLDVEPTSEYDPDTQSFVVTCNFELTVWERPNGADADKQTDVLSLSACFGALYTFELHENDAPIRLDEVDAFAVATGVFALYPYAREYIQGMTCRMGLPPLTLSVYKVPIEDPERSDRSSETAGRATPRAGRSSRKTSTSEEPVRSRPRSTPRASKRSAS